MKREQVKNEILKEFNPKFDIKKVFDKNGYTILENRGKKYCGCCGELIQTEKAKINKCNKCNAKLNPLDKYARTKTYVDYPYTSMYYRKSYKLDNWLLIRTFVMWNRQQIGMKATNVKCYEVMRIAINEKGEKIFSKIGTHQCMWNWDWNYGSDFAIKPFTDKYDFVRLDGDFTNKPNFLKYFDLNGYTKINEVIDTQKSYQFTGGVSVVDYIKGYTENPQFFETLSKLNRFDLLAFYMKEKSRDYSNYIFMLARKNKMIPTDDYKNYKDYLEGCIQLGKDLKNIDILCPTDFEKADNRVQRKIAEIKAKNELLLKVNDNKAYIKRVKNLLNKDFGNEKYSVLIIPSVEDFYLEGKVYFKNCCYAMSYYNKVKSLIFVIRDRETNKRCEMAELRENNKKSYDIQQCYGACNKTTENHDEIVSLLASQVNNIRNCLRG